MLIHSCRVFAALAAVWAVAVSVLIFVTPVSGAGIAGVVQPGSAGTTLGLATEQSWYDAQGLWGVVVLAFISAFYGFAVRIAWKGNHVGLLFAAVAAALISIVTAFSVGIAYLPSVLALLIAALLLLAAHWRRSRV